MAVQSRVEKSLKNAKINTLFYFINIVIAFISRKVFLEHLGDDFIGLTGTLSNILSLLSLAELGVGTATAYSLYKPLQEDDYDRTNELMSVFSYLYRVIGFVVLVLGCLIGLVFPLLFDQENLQIILVYLVFFSLLTSSLLGYFINYRQIILTADQKAYVVTGYLQGANVIKVIAQIAVAYYWGNLYVWTLLELLFAFVACVILNARIDKEYPWLSSSVKEGKRLLPDNKQLITNIKQIFVHRFANFVLRQSDQLFIFAFVSLKMVAFYGNYNLIVEKVSQAIQSALGGFSAGVGNLIAEGNKDKALGVFWEMMSMRFLATGVIVFGIYYLIEPFICLWIGSEYLLDRSILVLLLIVTFFYQTRGTVDMFKDGFGLFADTWAPVAETIINVVVTFSLAPFYGIAGLLIGKISSLSIIVFIWKPYYTFKHGFKESVFLYWKEYIKFLLALIISLLVAGLFSSNVISINPLNGFISWLFFAVVTCGIYIIVYVCLLWFMTEGTRVFLKRIYDVVLKRYVAKS